MTYKELAEILEKNIENKLYISGKLPTEDNIINEYKATRYCVRKAINLLIIKVCYMLFRRVVYLLEII